MLLLLFSPDIVACLPLVGGEQRLDFNYSVKNSNGACKKLGKDYFRMEDCVHRRKWDDSSTN